MISIDGGFPATRHGIGARARGCRVPICAMETPQSPLDFCHPILPRSYPGSLDALFFVFQLTSTALFSSTHRIPPLSTAHLTPCSSTHHSECYPFCRSFLSWLPWRPPFHVCSLTLLGTCMLSVEAKMSTSDRAPLGLVSSLPGRSINF